MSRPIYDYSKLDDDTLLEVMVRAKRLDIRERASSEYKTRLSIKDKEQYVNNELLKYYIDRERCKNIEQRSKYPSIYIVRLRSNEIVTYNSVEDMVDGSIIGASTEYRRDVAIVVDMIQRYGNDTRIFINSDYVNKIVVPSLERWRTHGYKKRDGEDISNIDIISKIAESKYNVANIRPITKQDNNTLNHILVMAEEDPSTYPWNDEAYETHKIGSVDYTKVYDRRPIIANELPLASSPLWEFVISSELVNSQEHNNVSIVQKVRSNTSRRFTTLSNRTTLDSIKHQDNSTQSNTTQPYNTAPSQVIQDEHKQSDVSNVSSDTISQHDQHGTSTQQPHIVNTSAQRPHIANASPLHKSKHDYCSRIYNRQHIQPSYATTNTNTHTPPVYMYNDTPFGTFAQDAPYAQTNQGSYSNTSNIRHDTHINNTQHDIYVNNPQIQPIVYNNYYVTVTKDAIIETLQPSPKMEDITDVDPVRVSPRSHTTHVRQSVSLPAFHSVTNRKSATQTSDIHSTDTNSSHDTRRKSFNYFVNNVLSPTISKISTASKISNIDIQQ